MKVENPEVVQLRENCAGQEDSIRCVTTQQRIRFFLNSLLCFPKSHLVGYYSCRDKP